MSKYWREAAILGLVLALVWMKSCADRGGEQPKIPSVLQRDLDSLRVTQPTHDARQDSARAQVRQDSILRVTAQRRAIQAEADARSSRRVADSLAAIAQTADEWHVAHDQRQQEAQRWEASSDAKEAALQTEIQSHARTRLAFAEETTRRQHLERVTIPGLEKAIARLDRPCKIGFIPCPSRTVIGVVSMGAGYLLGQALPLPIARAR